VNEHHEFSLAESAKLDPYGARIDKPRVSLFRIQDSCMSVRAHGIKFAEKLTDRDLSSLIKKAQVPDRKRPLAPTGVAARVPSSPSVDGLSQALVDWELQARL
jgi:hypothetical protein